jgi:hypothetical protein
MITPKEHRRDKLLSHGVPIAFLDAIETPPAEDLEFILRFPDAAYFYLPTIQSAYSILRGYDITPIFDGSNGDTFWVLLSNTSEFRFVHFELEQDEIYDDYGTNFMLLLADMVIRFYEFADELNESQIAEAARSMGFPQADELATALASADEQGLRSTFDSDAKWRRNNLPRIVKDGS